MAKSRQTGFGHFEVFAALMAIVAIGAISWYVWRLQNSNQAGLNHATDQLAAQHSGWNKTVTSGKGAYSVTFPDGWHVLRDTNSDSFMIGGEAQPEIKAGTAPVVTNTQFGSDGSVVLFMTLFTGSASVPNSTSSSYTLENGKENPIVGKKYFYEYPADQTGGLGSRLKGDKDYIYLFDLGNNKHLQVRYSIYGSDPRNMVSTVEALIRTIRLNS